MKHRRTASRASAGVALVMALVTLTVLAALVATWVARANARHRQARLAERQAQAAVLAEAALERAITQIAKGDSPAAHWEPTLYSGEKPPSPHDLRARAETAVEPAESGKDYLVIKVTASLERGDQVFVRITRQAKIKSPRLRAPDETSAP